MGPRHRRVRLVLSLSASVAVGPLGDVMLGRGVTETMCNAAPEALWAADLRELVGSLDAVVCNLECCISDRGSPTTLIAGKPFFFRAPPIAVEVLRAVSVSAVSLANNHALDFGQDALQDTLELPRAAGIATAGAGDGADAARKPAVVEAAGSRLALVAVTDYPRQYAAAPGRWGVAHAALRDELPSWVADQIACPRRRGDLVVAFPHWGPNMTTNPAGWQRRVAAGLGGAGADIVAGHSAHAFHGVGWSDGLVLFDLGGA